MRLLVLFVACTSVPLNLFAHLDGTPLGYTGAPTDHNGQTCAACHTPGNGPGRLTVSISPYTPGVTEAITVQIANDSAESLFAFQLTARLASDPTKQAGYFVSTTTSKVWCASGSCAAGANGAAIEYATNTLSAVHGTVGGQVFGVTWVPPGRDVGNVIFYAAAVAANGDGTPTGDHVYAVSVNTFTASCNLPGPPAINTGVGAVTDAASYRPLLSSNALLSIFGTGFAVPETLGIPGARYYQAQTNDLVSGAWPTELACVGVTVDGVRVPVFLAADGQINAQAPRFSGSERASIKVILNPDTPNAKTSGSAQVNAQPVAPALFTFNGAGTGNVAALDGSKGNAFLADKSVIASGVNASPGDIISIFGTGFGDTNPPVATGAFATVRTQLANPISITIGGVTVSSSDIQYAGLAFDAPGLYQVNVKVPNVPAGDQAIAVTVGNGASQTGATIPVE